MMFYFTSSMIHSVDLARYGVSRAKDLSIWSVCSAASKMSVFVYLIIIGLLTHSGMLDLKSNRI